jgi:ADP-ribosyl-[dinitrogen reductase] hydrolase
MSNNQKRKLSRQRLQNALWGLFIGDALAMPAHWYYKVDNIQNVFSGGIRDYQSPPHPHLESFMVGMTYHPDIETAGHMERPFDILNEHARFYNTSYGALQIRSTEREKAHGNLVPQLADRYHYHHGLKAGENTLAAHLVRVLMRSVIRCGRYDPNTFIEDFISHMITPGKNRDPYCEIYIRRWFENYTRGLPPHGCAELQRNIWSIGSHGGIIRPLVISMLAGNAYQGLGLAIEHQILTHRSENVSSALGVLVPLLQDLLTGTDPDQVFSGYAQRVHTPQITGDQLFQLYRDHQGPGNIPKQKMWELHTLLFDAPYEVDRLVREDADSPVINQLFATACYPEHGVPLLLYFAKSNNMDVETALLANTNAGGDNVHRGMILGILLGAANKKLPEHLKSGLIAFDEIRTEIEAFSDIVLNGNAI